VRSNASHVGEEEDDQAMDEGELDGFVLQEAPDLPERKGQEPFSSYWGPSAQAPAGPFRERPIHTRGGKRKKKKSSAALIEARQSYLYRKHDHERRDGPDHDSDSISLMQSPDDRDLMHAARAAMKTVNVALQRLPLRAVQGRRRYRRGDGGWF